MAISKVDDASNEPPIRLGLRKNWVIPPRPKPGRKRSVFRRRTLKANSDTAPVQTKSEVLNLRGHSQQDNFQYPPVAGDYSRNNEHRLLEIIKKYITENKLLRERIDQLIAVSPSAITNYTQNGPVLSSNHVTPSHESILTSRNVRTDAHQIAAVKFPINARQDHQVGSELPPVFENKATMPPVDYVGERIPLFRKRIRYLNIDKETSSAAPQPGTCWKCQNDPFQRLFCLSITSEKQSQAYESSKMMKCGQVYDSFLKYDGFNSPNYREAILELASGRNGMKFGIDKVENALKILKGKFSRD